MRKLKFKIWNKREKSWHRSANSIAVNGELAYNLEDAGVFTFVQFVNLYDMHGNELYEGDIIEYHNGKSDFGNKSFVYFTPKFFDHFPGFVIEHLHSQHGDFEIIGNVFENYDLISDDPVLCLYNENVSYLLK